MPRLFVALYPPDPVIAALSRVRTGTEGVRWTRPEQLHLTLAFLGDVDDERAAVVAGALDEVEAPHVRLRLDHLAVFPNRRRPRVFVATLDRDPRLVALHEAVSGALASVGFEPERRPFRPHVTLARFRRPSPATATSLLDLALSPAEAVVDAFHLVESVLRPSGAAHSTREHYPLRSAS